MGVSDRIIQQCQVLLPSQSTSQSVEAGPQLHQRQYLLLRVPTSTYISTPCVCRYSSHELEESEPKVLFTPMPIIWMLPQEVNVWEGGSRP